VGGLLLCTGLLDLSENSSSSKPLENQVLVLR
jgi:hypothetical protein